MLIEEDEEVDYWRDKIYKRLKRKNDISEVEEQILVDNQLLPLPLVLVIRNRPHDGSKEKQ